MLFSCERTPKGDGDAEDTFMTEYCEHLSIVDSQNGRRSYHFTTPLMEGYSQAREPYREFRKGVKITTYQDDSLSTVDAVLTANYAIYYEKRELWEAKGDVVVEKSDGKTLYTQQLFWNARTKKIYSNVDSKIVQSGGTDVFIGEGFESDEEFKDWRFRRMKGRMEVDVAPTDSVDRADSPNSPNDSDVEPGNFSNAADRSAATSADRSAVNAPAAPVSSGTSASKLLNGPASARLVDVDAPVDGKERPRPRAESRERIRGGEGDAADRAAIREEAVSTSDESLEQRAATAAIP